MNIDLIHFSAFEMKSEDIIADGVPNLSRHTAQIHNDFFYVFDAVDQKEEENNLWRFDLSKRTQSSLFKKFIYL